MLFDQMSQPGSGVSAMAQTHRQIWWTLQLRDWIGLVGWFSECEDSSTNTTKQKKHFFHVICHMSHVTCLLSPVTSQLSPVTYYRTTTLCSFSFYESPIWLCCQIVSLTFVSVRQTKSADFSIAPGIVSVYQTKPTVQYKMERASSGGQKLLLRVLK